MWKSRVAGAPLAGLLLLGLAWPARAGELFGRFKNDCAVPCTTEVVKIPGHQLVVETARPQVVVNETRVVHAKPRRVTAAVPVQAVAPAPMVATIFTPMASLPVAPMAAPMAVAPHFSAVAGTPEPAPRTALNALHDMEYHSLEVQKLHAAQKLEMDHAQSVLHRMSATLRSGLSGYKSSNGDDEVKSELRKEVERLQGLVNGTSERTTRVESALKDLHQLCLAHDEVIKQKVLHGTLGSSADTKKLEDMIKELQKLVLRHDDLLRDLVKQRAMPLPPGPPAAMTPANR